MKTINSLLIVLVLLGGFMLYGSTDKNLPRGVRNKNPLNIRNNPANNWKGKTGVDDKDFVVFENEVYGIRAAAKILQSYASRGIVSIKDILNTFAPKIENPTDNYVRFVSQRLNVSPDYEPSFNEYPALLYAMTEFETGLTPYDLQTFKQGVSLA